MRVCLAVIVAASAAIAAPAAADDAGRMQAFTRSDFYLDLAERAIAALPPVVFRAKIRAGMTRVRLMTSRSPGRR